MWRSAGLLFLLALIPEPDTPEVPSDVCDAEAIVVWSEAIFQQGEEASRALASRLEPMIRAQQEGSACRVMLVGTQLTAFSVAEEHDRILEITARMLADPSIARYPDIRMSMYRERAKSLDARGRVVESLQTLIQATETVDGVTASRASALFLSLADAALSHGDWARADVAQVQALRILRDSAATDPVRTPVRIGKLLAARAYRFQQEAAATADPDARRRLARRALALADSGLVLLDTYETDSPTEYAFYQGKRALALADGAFAEAVLGRHARARDRMRRAHRLATREAMNLLSYLESDLWRRESEVAEMDGRFQEAARAALASRNTCAEQEDIWCEAAGIEQIGRIAERTGDLGSAEQAYRRAVTLRDIEWERARLQDWGASAFASAQAPYRGLTRVLIRQGRVEESFTTLDGARARAMRDMRDRMELRNTLTGARRVRVDSLLEAIQTERLRSDGTVREQANTDGRISRLNQQVQAETRRPREVRASVNLPGLQRVLTRQKRSLVSYLVGDSTSIAFVVTSDTLVARTLPLGGGAIGRLMVSAGGPWSGSRRAVQTQALHSLHEALIRPLRDVLPTEDGLVIVPDGPLADLPFGALVERLGDDYASTRFLVQRQPISTDLAAALITGVPRSAPAFDLDLVAFGRERFDGGHSEGGMRGGPVLANLPYVPAELDRIQRQIGNREVSLDGDATEARFDADASRARIVHVASHAEVDAAFPLYSRIYLWDDPEQSDDGILHLFELQNLGVPADLVVLSGCSTASGQTQAGEGTIGLQYGIRSGGAQSTLATLWPVDDRATAEIIGSFYDALSSGASKDVALQQAQVTYLDAHGGAEASPFFWAAPVLSGNPAPIPLAPPTPSWPLALGGLAVVLGAGGLAWRFRSRRSDA